MSLQNLPDELVLHIMSFIHPTHQIDTKYEKVKIRTNIKAVDKRFNTLWKERIREFSVKRRKMFLVQQFGFSQAIRFCLKNKDDKVLELLKKSKCCVA